jgi:hypothetical protein
MNNRKKITDITHSPTHAPEPRAPILREAVDMDQAKIGLTANVAIALSLTFDNVWIAESSTGASDGQSERSIP